MKIGIFDSGLGGLFTLRAIRAELPEYDYVYLGDTKHLPYGSRSHDEIFQFLKEGLALFESTGDYPKYALDQYWKRLQSVGRWYIVRPNLGFQLPGYSNVEGKPVNYLRYFK